MITEEYLKDNFVSAYFIDQDRKNIEVLTTTEDKKKLKILIIQSIFIRDVVWIREVIR